MELDFRNSFVANSQAAPETNTTSIKASENTENKSFEKTLNDKRKETESEKTSDERKTEKQNKKDKTEKKAEKAEKPEKDVKDSAESEKPEKTDNVKKPETHEEQPNVRKPEDATENVKLEVQPEMQVEIVPEIETPVLTAEESAELVAQIAEVLGVAPEQVTEALEKLEIMPEELAVNGNMNKLVAEVKGLNEPAELLTEPGISETLKELKAIVNDALLNADSATTESKVSPETAVLPKQAVEAAQAQPIVVPEVNTEAEIKVENPVQIAQTAQEAQNTQNTQNTTQNTRNAQNEKPLADEADVTEEAPGESAQPQNRVRVPANEQQSTDTGTQQGGNFNGQQTQETQTSQKEVTTDETQSAPIIIQKGDETVIEIGGRTVSRTVTRPATQDAVTQIIEKMKVDFKPGQTELKINLRPAELGNVTVKLVTENGVVTAEIVTENSKVKELVEQNLETLRENLKEQGVEVGGLSVSVGQQENDERMEHFIREQAKSRTRMSRIIDRINSEEAELESENYANESETVGYTVDYSA